MGAAAPPAACRLRPAMTGPLLLALLGLCLPLAAGRQSLVVKDLNFNKFSGFWYEIAFASKVHAPRARPVVGVQMEWEGGHLALTTAYRDETGCVTEKRVAMKGDVLGKFKLPKEFGDREISVVSTDYGTYAILHVQAHAGAARAGLLKLCSRALEHDQDVLEKFHQVARDCGFSEQDVRLHTWDRRCAELLKEVSVLAAPPQAARQDAPAPASGGDTERGPEAGGGRLAAGSPLQELI